MGDATTLLQYRLAQDPIDPHALSIAVLWNPPTIPALPTWYTFEQSALDASVKVPVPRSITGDLNNSGWASEALDANATSVKVSAFADQPGSAPALDSIVVQLARPNTTAVQTLTLPSEKPPRLVLALNSTSLPAAVSHSALDFKNPGKAEILHLLQCIYRGLSAKSFEPLWDSPDGRGSANSVPAKPDLEEQWARLMAEKFTLSPYALPSVVYKRSDDQVMAKLQDDADPAHSLVGECQHLVTAAALGRGHSFALKNLATGKSTPTLTTMFTAGNSKGAVDILGPEGQAKWIDANAFNPPPPPSPLPPDFPSACSVSTLPTDTGPGSSFAFTYAKPGDSRQEIDSNPHTAFVLRILRVKDAKTISKLQFFDTGGVAHPFSEEGPMPAETKPSGIFEYGWRTLVRGPSTIVGMGKLNTSPETLTKGVERLERARPLGLARLILARTKNLKTGNTTNFYRDPLKNWLLYASPLRLMYESGPDQNYSIARYLWSLRNLPGADEVQAFWQLSAPRSTLFDAIAYPAPPTNTSLPSPRKPRDFTIRELIERVGPKGTILARHDLYLGCIDVTSKKDGTVAVLDSGDTVTHPKTDYKFVRRDRDPPVREFPWGKASTGIAGLDVESEAFRKEVPAYFVDEVPPPPTPPVPSK